MTLGGWTCKHWDADEKKKNPNLDLDHNYCRRLGDSETIWCQVDEADDKRGWDSCEPKEMTNVEYCSGLNCSGYRGQQS